MKYTNQFLRYFDAFPVFSVRDVKLFLLKNGANVHYYKIFIYNMVKSGKVHTIGRGCYTLHDDPMVAGFAFSPFYYGMETALTYYKLWNYMTPISIITTKRVRKGNIELLGRNVTVRRIQKNKFFGYTMVDYGGGPYIPMADIEKTLIDSVYFHSHFSRDVYSEIVKRIDRKRLDGYLKRYSKIVKKQVNNVIKFSALPRELTARPRKRGIRQNKANKAVKWSREK